MLLQFKDLTRQWDSQLFNLGVATAPAIAAIARACICPQAPKPAKATLVCVGDLTVVECLFIQM